ALTLYPNPARAEAVRVLPGATTGSVIDVLDALGRVVRTVARTEGATNITVSLKGLPAGLYRVRCGAGSVPLVIAD
ncbi:MAG TPA: T9SS type A sorting domain-containing protein, partial [bacterium]|nr:T9SS type A sorting domain-containing protein [bacterium]